MTVVAGARSGERSWQSRGAAIVRCWLAVAVSATLGDRMGAAGAVSDLWGATATAAGGALGTGWQELDGGPRRSFRSVATGRCRQPSGAGTASHESARPSRLGTALRYAHE